jgi:hypothetical protein
MDERHAFLDQAIRAGNKLAIIDYRVEGPNGFSLDELPANDPNLLVWKQRSNALLQQLAETGDRTAWVILATDYELGLVTTKDYAAAVKYTAALHPAVDVTKAAYVAAMAAELPPAKVQQAIQQGQALAKQFPSQRG